MKLRCFRAIYGTNHRAHACNKAIIIPLPPTPRWCAFLQISLTQVTQHHSLLISHRTCATWPPNNVEEIVAFFTHLLSRRLHPRATPPPPLLKLAISGEPIAFLRVITPPWTCPTLFLIRLISLSNYACASSLGLGNGAFFELRLPTLGCRKLDPTSTQALDLGFRSSPKELRSEARVQARHHYFLVLVNDRGKSLLGLCFY